MNFRSTVTFVGCLLSVVIVAACGSPPPLDTNTSTGIAQERPSPDAGSHVRQSNAADRSNSVQVGSDSESPAPPEVKENLPQTEVDPEDILPSGAGFTHPGVLVDLDQLRYVRNRIASGEQPWTDAYVRMRDGGGSSATAARPKHYRFSSLDYPPAQVKEVRCWAGTGKNYADAHPELNLTESGCREQTDDAMAAYTQALMWYFTGDEAYAKKAIEIMNAWSYKLSEIKFDQPRTSLNQQIFANGILQAAWTGQIMPRAAEIIRYTYNGWNQNDIRQFSSMLNNVILPVIVNGWTGGANGLMSYPEAIMGIGVFNDNRPVFDLGVSMWRKNVKTVIYMPQDGAQPIAPSPMYAGSNTYNYWFKPSSYIAGLGGETGRDLSHTLMGLGAMSNGAATAYIQGVDLFNEERARIVSAYELHAGFVNQYLDEKARLGGKEPAASWRPAGWVNPTFAIGGTAYRHGWEVAFNHFKALGVAMPQTQRVVQRLRPSGPAMTLTWETLTHAT